MTWWSNRPRKQEPRNADVRMREDEEKVLNHLCDAWGGFLKLPGTKDEWQDFVYHIHALQHLIALQVAKRADPDLWRQGD